jgi:hypothetical protein
MLETNLALWSAAGVYPLSNPNSNEPRRHQKYDLSRYSEHRRKIISDRVPPAVIRETEVSEMLACAVGWGKHVSYDPVGD